MFAWGRRRAAGLGLVAATLVLAPSAGGASLYATNQAVPGSVAQFTLGPTGALTPVACSADCAVAQTPYGIAISPRGDELFTSGQVASPASGEVSGFAIGPEGGLAPISCSACETGPGTSPLGIAVDPTEPYVYTTSDTATGGVLGFAIGSGGTLSPLPCTVTSCPTGSDPRGIAIDPSGRFLYTTNGGSDSISAYAIGAGGSLSPIPCSRCAPVSGGDTPGGVAIDPTGRYVYVTNFMGGSSTPAGALEAFAIGPTGALTPLPCGVACETGSGSQPFDVVVDPAGLHVYVADTAGDQLDAFSINADGTLTRIKCTSGCATSPAPKTLAIDPSGQFLYVGHENSTISVFSIGRDGSLSPIPCALCQTSGPSYGIVLTPDPGPTASLLTSPAPAGTATTLSAAGSSSPTYPIASYAWSFGDGSTTTTVSPTVAHVYSMPGTYDASVTVTDQAACSTTVIFTGQSPYCDGSAKATTTSVVDIANPLIEPPPSILEVTNARESHRVWREGRRHAQAARLRRPVPTGTIFAFDVNEKARVTLTFALAKPGRRVGRRCVAKTAHNHGVRRCVRYVRQAAISFTSHPGENTVGFQGRLRRRRWLPLGSYTVTIGASARGHQRATPARLTFRIVQ